MTHLLIILVLCSIIGGLVLRRFERGLLGAGLGLILGPLGLLVVALIFTSLKAEAQQKAHDLRLKAMLNATLKASQAKAKAATAVAAPRSPELVQPLRKERECPFCAELILEKARVCKHCGRDVEPLA